MKNKFASINVLLMIAVLFSMLFQSLDSFVHYKAQLSEKECHHKYNTTNTEITHQHHSFEHCFVCKFSLGSFLSPNKLNFQRELILAKIPYFFAKNQTTNRFSGSVYCLRGPPFFIV